MRIQFLEELEYILHKNNISKNEICIIGSSVLAFYGIRENHDLDFALYPEIRFRILENCADQIELLPSGTINFSENTQALQSRYAKIGLLDEELFDDAYAVNIEGYRVARIEVEIAQKIERNFEKDRKDLAKIGNNYEQFPEFDNKLFEKLTKRKAIIYGAGTNAKLAYYCYCAKFELICYVDKNKELWGTELNGLKVCPPDVIEGTDAVIVISSRQYAEEIKKEIYAKYGKHKVITFCMSEELTITGGSYREWKG